MNDVVIDSIKYWLSLFIISQIVSFSFFRYRFQVSIKLSYYPLDIFKGVRLVKKLYCPVRASIVLTLWWRKWKYFMNCIKCFFWKFIFLFSILSIFRCPIQCLFLDLIFDHLINQLWLFISDYINNSILSFQENIITWNPFVGGYHALA